MKADMEEPENKKANETGSQAQTDGGDEKSKGPGSMTLGVGIGIGAGIGAALGAALGNVAIGVALGAGMGVAVGAAMSSVGRA